MKIADINMWSNIAIMEALIVVVLLLLVVKKLR